MPHRILVADDSSTIQKVIKIAFSRFDADMIEAASFLEALAAAGRAPLDLMILDASLPGAQHGAVDFAKLAGTAGSTPVLLLVGTYEAVDESAFRAQGFKHFLRKPFESADLVSLADQLLGGSLTGASKQAASTRPTHTTVIHAPGSFPGIDSLDDVDVTKAPGTPSVRGVVPAGRGQPPPSMPPVFDASLGGDDDLEDANGEPVPPPPMTDQSRRGRRAFDGPEGTGTGVPPPPGRTVGGGVSVPPPPLTMRLGDEEDDPDATASRPAYRPGDGASPLPPIPPGAGLGGRGTAPPPRAPSPQGDRGLDLDLDLGTHGGFSPRVSGGHPRDEAGQGSHGGQSAPGGPGPLDGQLPAWVRQAVEDYCERHFKSLAREVIASELRRLADEKARHLVDN